MGHKVNPVGFRLAANPQWNSRWFAVGKNYKDLLLEDYRLREALYQKLKFAGLAQVEIGRSINRVDITLHVARPGVVIGRGGKDLEVLKKYINSLLSHGKKKAVKVEIKIEPVKEQNLSARLVAQSVADQLIKRLPHRRIMRHTMTRVMSAGAKGVRIMLSGRIAGAEISRREKYQEGSMPLSTIREDIDYASQPARTKSGYIGVKVWISKK